jgi:translocation and assembly module TamB
VRKGLRYGLLSLSAVVVILVGAAVWFLGTPGGARWILSFVSGHSATKVSAGAVEGRLWGDLELERLEIRWPQGSATVGRAHIRWRPMALLMMHVSVDDLDLEQVYVQDNSPQKPVDFKWPSLTGVPSLLSAKVRTLRVKGLVYRKLDQSPFAITGISAGADWYGGSLSLKDFYFAMDAVSVRGKLSAGLVRPSLKTDLIIVLAKPVEKMNRFSVKADLLPARSPVQAEGAISVIASGEKTETSISGEVGVERKELILEKLHISRTASAGYVTGSVRISFAESSPEFEGNLQLEGIDLSAEISMKTNLFGRITLKGTTDGYGGNLSLMNKSENWRSAGIAGSFSGNLEGLKMEIEKGMLLKGDISGAVEANWSKGVRLKGSLEGRDLNPSAVSPDWTGSVNLDIDAQVDLSGKEAEGNVKARLLESRLHGRNLSGRLDAEFQGRNVRVADFFLMGRGFKLRAKGELSKRLSFSADVTNLSLLLPDSEGSLQAKGWARLKGDNLSGAVSGRSCGLVYQAIRAQGIDIDAEISGLKGRPVALKADIRGLSYKGINLDRLTSRIDGAVVSHQIAIDASRKGLFELQAEIEGSYKDRIWEGDILRLRGHDAAGTFVLDSPVKVLLSGTEMSFSPIILKGIGLESVSAAVKISRSGAGFVKASFEKFNMARLNQWLGGERISGTVSGNIGAGLQKNAVIRADAFISLSGAFSSAGQAVRIGNGTLRFSWDNRGLDSSLRVVLEGGGFLKGRITSPLPPAMDIPASGNLNLDWNRLNLVLLDPWLSREAAMSGSSNGTVSAVWKDRSIASVNADIKASGTLSSGGRRFGVKSSSVKVNWNSSGLRASFDMKPAEGGQIQGTFLSHGKPRLDLPDRGEVRADLKDFDPSIFRQWLPQDVVMRGNISGHAEGRVSPGRILDVSGDISVTKGSVTYHTAKGLVSAEMKKARVEWVWRGDTFRGDVSLALAEYGSLTGHFGLPVPARIPLSPNPSGQMNADFSAKMKENGILTFLFPGMVQESHGDLDLALKVAGTWSSPVLGGSIQLAHAGGFFPSTGIRLKNVLLRGNLDNNKFVVDVFQAESGKGALKGAASFLIEKWHVKSYSGALKGDKFRVVYLPELRAEINPEVTFKGDGKKFFMRGHITVHHLLISEPKTPPPVEPSKDVVIVDREREKTKHAPLQLDLEVHVAFPSSLFVKAEGIDAQFKGDLVVTVHDVNDIRGKGSLNVVRGTYKNYGVDLKIQRGLISFTGRIGNPSLDALALRTVNDIRAGVVVSGTLEKPVIKMYSNPPMSETDILAYIVFGHPLGGGSGEQSALLMKAASVLLSRGESSSLQDQLQKKLGIDVLDVENTTAPGAQVTPGTPAPGTPESTAARSLITVGKYLTPKLYISYGQSLFKSGNLFKMRYSLSRHFDIESQSGVESGVDFVYKINFK